MISSSQTGVNPWKPVVHTLLRTVQLTQPLWSRFFFVAGCGSMLNGRNDGGEAKGEYGGQGSVEKGVLGFK